MTKIFPRNKYLNKIKPFIGQEIIKVILGQRRTGKSYFLRQVAEFISHDHKQTQIIYIDKERYDFADIKTADDLVKYVQAKKESDSLAVFIDEVQEIKDFELAVRDFFSRGYDLYIAGSNSSLLAGELATSLSGRYVTITIYPLTYSEFVEFHGLRSDSDSLNKYLEFGGMPYLQRIGLQREVVREYLLNLYNTIVLKDIVNRYQLKNIDLLNHLTYFLADNIGSTVSANSITKFLKSQKLQVNHNIILNYLEYMCQAFLVGRVRRYDLKGKRYLEVQEKYYFTDIGLRNFLVEFKPADIGKLLENVVYMHLIANGYDVSIGKLYEAEIDFIARQGEKRMYIQVAYLLADQTTIDREFGNLLKIKDAYPKFVVTLDPIKFPDYQGVKHFQLKDFLLQLDSEKL